MLKKAGILALLLSAAGAVFAPATAFAQDGNRSGYYSGDRDGHQYRGDHDRDRHERREWRGHERREENRDWRANEWRANDWREHDWREHNWRERERWENRYDRDRGPGAYFYYGYGR